MLGLTADEIDRYKARGWWLILAWGLAATWFFGLPELAKAYWPQILAPFKGDDRAFFVFTSWLCNFGLTVLGNCVFGVLYALQVPYIERNWKIGDKAWPWQSPDPAERARFRSFVRTSIARVLFNNTVLTIPALIWTWPTATYLNAFSSSLDDWPSYATLALHLAACMAIEDLMFYTCHRTLHHPRLYPHIHKIHHQYFVPIALSSEHAHPVEFLAGNLLPVIAGPLLLRVHTVTLWMWVLLRIGVSIDEHCGYALPFSPVRLLPWGASAEGHDFHHSHNQGIYASQWLFWDRVFGTDRAFNEWMAQRAAARAAAATVQAEGPQKPRVPVPVPVEDAAGPHSPHSGRSTTSSTSSSNRKPSGSRSGSRSPKAPAVHLDKNGVVVQKQKVK